MDKEKAHIIINQANNEEVITIQSEVENYHITGGSGTRFKGGPQDVIQDSRYFERKKHQLKSYFKEIVSIIKYAHAIVIFGPADTNHKFKRELTENYKDIAEKIKAVIKADSMTINQVKALTRNFYNTNKIY